MLALVVLVVSLVIASSESFLLTRVVPGKVAVQSGKGIDLLCAVDSDYEFCRWINPQQQFCDFVWKRATGNITTQECQIPDKVSFHGRYNDRECGIRINSASVEDTGKWRCEVEQYVFLGRRGSGALRTSQIEVRVESSTPTYKPNTTTSTSRTTQPTHPTNPTPLQPISTSTLNPILWRGMLKNQANITQISEDINQQKEKTFSLEMDMAAQRIALHAVNWEVSTNRVDIGNISVVLALHENKTSSLAEDVTAQGKAIEEIKQGMSKNQAAIDQDLALLENQTSSLAKGLTTQGISIDAVERGMSQNRANISKISEQIAQQRNKTSSLEENMAIQRSDLNAVNWGVSKNWVGIEEISTGLALQENKTSSLAEEVRTEMKNMMKKIQELGEEFNRQKQIIEGQKELIEEQDATISRLNHTLQGLLPVPVDCMVTTWRDWGSCSATCGGGTMSRSREVAQQPMHGGKPCPVLEEKNACNTELCAGTHEVNTEHNIIEQFEHLRLQDPILFGWDYESSGYGDECWEYCHPDTRNSDSMDCNHCPSSDEPDRWREFADLGIEHVQCSTDLATLPYDLSNLIEVGWIDESWTLEISFFSANSELSEPEKLKQYKISTDLESYKNKGMTAEISGLRSGYQYNVCLQLVKDENLKTEQFCQPCRPKGPPPANPSEITVGGGT